MAAAEASTPHSCHSPRVAVIGGGISGLSAAWALSLPRTGCACGQKHANAAHVTLFERWSVLGMDAFGQTVSVGGGDATACAPIAGATASADTAKRALKFGAAQSVRIDLPLRVFSPTYYEALGKLYAANGIGTEPCDHAAAFFAQRDDASPPALFRFTNADYRGWSLPFASLSGMSLTIVWDYARLLLIALSVSLGLEQLAEDASLGDFLASRSFSSRFTDGVLIPSLAAMLTCCNDSVRAYPAGIILEYVLFGAMSRTRRVCGGAAEVVERLSRDIPDVRLGARVCHVRPLTPVERGSSSASVMVVHEDGRMEEFDHVIFATQANQALNLVGGAAAPTTIRKALSSFKYESSVTVIHTDASFMPAQKRDWSSVVFFLQPPRSACASGAAATAPLTTVETIIAGSPTAADMSQRGAHSRPEATIWLNAAQRNMGHVDVDVFQTWNPHTEPARDKIIKSVAFDRPVLDAGAVAGMKLLASVQGTCNMWWCGSFALYGMPLLDNGVAAGLRVACALGAQLPWQDASATLLADAQRDVTTIYRIPPSTRRRNVVRMLALPVSVLLGVLLAAVLLWWVLQHRSF